MVFAQLTYLLQDLLAGGFDLAGTLLKSATEHALTYFSIYRPRSIVFLTNASFFVPLLVSSTCICFRFAGRLYVTACPVAEYSICAVSTPATK